MFCHIDYIVPKAPFFRAKKKPFVTSITGFEFQFSTMAREKTEKVKETKLGVFIVFYRLHSLASSLFVSFVIFLEFENSGLGALPWCVCQPGLDECALFICLEFENLLSAGSIAGS